MKIKQIRNATLRINFGDVEFLTDPCPVLKAGQVFYATNTCPKGMCDAAWRTINQYVFALACGVREFYGGGWMKEPGKVITCCNDGLRPVYFKLEATDREAGPFLGRE